MAKRSWNNDGVDQDSLAQRDEAKGERYSSGGPMQGYIKDDTAMYIPAVGKKGEKILNQVRIVQPLEIQELRYYGMDVHFHRNVGINNDMFLCLKRMFKKPCPICEEQTPELWDNDPDLAKTYYPDWRVLMWVIDIHEGDEEKQGQVLLWSCPRKLAEEILGQSHKPGTGVYLDVSHPTRGRTVFFNRAGKGLQTEYTSVQLDDEEMELSDELLDQMQRFIDVLVVPTYAEVKAVHENQDAGDRASSVNEPTSQEDSSEETTTVGGDGFDTLDRIELKKYINANDLGIKPRRDWTDDDLRNAIREKVGKASEPPPNCFKKEYDQLDECSDGCTWAGACGEVEVKPDIQKATSSRTRVRKDAPAPETAGDEAISDVKAKLKAAIKKRQGKA